MLVSTRCVGEYMYSFHSKDVETTNTKNIKIIPMIDSLFENSILIVSLKSSIIFSFSQNEASFGHGILLKISNKINKLMKIHFYSNFPFKVGIFVQRFGRRLT